MEKIGSYLGENSVLQGRLTFKGNFNLDCNFKGDISAPGTLIVGENGKIDSNIHVRSIICKGEILGNIIAEERVEILSSGRVYGDIWAPVVVVKKGAIFEGNCLTNEIKVIRSEKPDAAVSKTSEVVQLYDSIRQESKVDQFSEAC
jgi:cytoskeletal protein CcmA (bactofilin family)